MGYNSNYYYYHSSYRSLLMNPIDPFKGALLLLLPFFHSLLTKGSFAGRHRDPQKSLAPELPAPDLNPKPWLGGTPLRQFVTCAGNLPFTFQFRRKSIPEVRLFCCSSEDGINDRILGHPSLMVCV